MDIHTIPRFCSRADRRAGPGGRETETGAACPADPAAADGAAAAAAARPAAADDGHAAASCRHRPGPPPPPTRLRLQSLWGEEERGAEAGQEDGHGRGGVHQDAQGGARRFQRGGILNSVQTGGEGVCVRLAVAPC